VVSNQNDEWAGETDCYETLLTARK
jgi:hypothetical protein